MSECSRWTQFLRISLKLEHLVCMCVKEVFSLYLQKTIIHRNHNVAYSTYINQHDRVFI